MSSEPFRPLVSNGGSSQQESSQQHSFRSDHGLDQVAQEGVACDLLSDALVGEHDQADRGDGVRSTHDTNQQDIVESSQPSDGENCLGTTSNASTTQPESERHVKCDKSEYPQPGVQGTDWRCPRPGSDAGRAPTVLLSADSKSVHGLYQRSQPREDVSSLSKGDWESVQVLSLDGVPANERPANTQSGQSRIGQDDHPGGDQKDDSRGVLPTCNNDQGRKQCIPGPGQLQEMWEDPGDCQKGRQEDRGAETIQGMGTVPEVLAMEGGPDFNGQQLNQKTMRKIKRALKNSTQFWKEIRDLFVRQEVDEETISSKIQSLNQELLSDIVRNPKGTKRTKRIAETMNLSLPNLRTLAEIYNPGCFGKHAKDFGLTAGLAFDIELGTNLLEEDNRERVKEYLHRVKPGLVLIAPPCHMYSQLQNLLQGLRQVDKEALKRYQKKKKQAKILLAFAVEVAEICRSIGTIFVLEHPWAASSWTTPELTKLLKHEDVNISRTDQCMFGLRGTPGELQRKRTGFASNSLLINQALEVQCNKEHQHEHIIGGHRSRQAQKYPEALIHLIFKTYAKSIRGKLILRTSEETLDQERVIDNWMMECLQPIKESELSQKFAGHEILEVSGEQDELRIDEEQNEDDQAEPDQPIPIDQEPEEAEGGRDLPHQRPIRLRRLIQKAHEGLGHPHQDRFLRILKFSKASPEVMREARNFRCAACIRNSQVKPARRAAPPRELTMNQTLGIDVVFLPKQDGTTQPALNLIDWATHFQMVIPIESKSPDTIREAYRHWIRIFGPPTNLASDLGREFEGSFALRAETDGTFLDPSSVESPYQRGIAERAGKSFKLMLSKALESHPCETDQEWRELVDIVNMQKNRLLMKNGFSPIQRVIGYSPKLPGGMLTGDAANRSFPDKVRLGDQGVIRAMNMRKAAALAFHSTECEEALRRAIESGPRPIHDFGIGETVYFWRIGQGATRKPAPAYWHGPCKVVMTDPPSTVWLSYQGTLVKASPERIRRASEEEQLTLSGWIDDLVGTLSELETEPKRGFLDICDDPLPPNSESSNHDENIPSQDQEEDEVWQGPLPPVTKRFRIKAPVPFEASMEADMDIELDTEQPTGAAREEADMETMPAVERSVESQQADASSAGAQPEQDNIDNDLFDRKREHEDHPEDHEEPASKRTRPEYLEILMTKLESLRKTRQRKEVQVKSLSKFNQDCFWKATQKEIKNNLETKAYEPVSLEESAKIRQSQPDKVMESRYVCTAKPLEPLDVLPAKESGLLLDWDNQEPCKAKVRHVMKGFSEEGAELLNSTTPQVTREGSMFVAQMIASHRWRLGFMDFTQAFHSGDPINRTLFCEQPREGVPGMVPGQLIRLLKCWYGLTDGPHSWFMHIRRVLVEDLGYQQSLADPCIFMLFGQNMQLHGIIGLATDDLLHGGDSKHLDQMHQLKQRYKLGKFQFDEGRFTGKDFAMDKNFNIHVTQNAYANTIESIPMTNKRKRCRYSFCTDDEVSQLRAALGALAWLAKETRPELAGKCRNLG